MTRGFSLIEMTVTIALVAILGAAVFSYVDIGAYRGDAFEHELQTITGLLQSVRADAMNNVDETAHGIVLHSADHPHGYVLFEGSSYAARDQSKDIIVEADYPLEINDAPIEIVFGPLSGDSSFDGALTLKDPIRKLPATITINREGTISR